MLKMADLLPYDFTSFAFRLNCDNTYVSAQISVIHSPMFKQCVCATDVC